MKNILSILLATMFCLSIFGCKGGEREPGDNPYFVSYTMVSDDDSYKVLDQHEKLEKLKIAFSKAGFREIESSCNVPVSSVKFQKEEKLSRINIMLMVELYPTQDNVVVILSIEIKKAGFKYRPLRNEKKAYDWFKMITDEIIGSVIYKGVIQ